MNLLPQVYLLGLVGLLLVIAVVVSRQLLRVRRDEARLIQLEQVGASASCRAADLYELGSIQLRKRFYPQAAATLKQALKHLDDEPDEAKALIENALGFALAAQKDYRGAIQHYKVALRAKGDYPVAINNLAFAQEKLFRNEEAIVLYRRTLELEPNNSTAKKGLKKLEKQV
ncbi:tetratricopeptide repeat protein [Synechococcus sp. M16CYN]|uniref:tetratricopeptide repeat protein n=1 Tax=Synechococcus sp. M16CYN TaxID=3103139 RepID=UPI00324A07F8